MGFIILLGMNSSKLSLGESLTVDTRKCMKCTCYPREEIFCEEALTKLLRADIHARLDHPDLNLSEP